MNNELEIIEDLIERFANPDNFDPILNVTKNPTPRIKVICEKLEELGIPYELDEWQSGARWLYNVYCNFGPTEGKIRLLDAHHDVHNNEQENAQDNTCSVINLIVLANRLNENAPDVRTIIAITDGEEIKPGGSGSGAARATEKFRDDLHSAYALELTGVGDHIWSSNPEMNMEDVTVKSCPFNNSYMYRKATQSATCIGILSEREVNGYPTTWMLCHSKTDTFAKCSTEDMAIFANWLYELCFTELEPEIVRDPVALLGQFEDNLKHMFGRRADIITTEEFESDGDHEINERALIVVPSTINPLFVDNHYIIDFDEDKDDFVMTRGNDRETFTGMEGIGKEFVSLHMKKTYQI